MSGGGAGKSGGPIGLIYQLGISFYRVVKLNSPSHTSHTHHTRHTWHPTHTHAQSRHTRHPAKRLGLRGRKLLLIPLPRSPLNVTQIPRRSIPVEISLTLSDTGLNSPFRTWTRCKPSYPPIRRLPCFSLPLPLVRPPLPLFLLLQPPPLPPLRLGLHYWSCPG